MILPHTNSIVRRTKTSIKLNCTQKSKGTRGKSVRVYSIDALYGHIDALWKENKIKYSTLALMAWVYLSRELSSCF